MLRNFHFKNHIRDVSTLALLASCTFPPAEGPDAGVEDGSDADGRDSDNDDDDDDDDGRTSSAGESDDATGEQEATTNGASASSGSTSSPATTGSGGATVGSSGPTSSSGTSTSGTQTTLDGGDLGTTDDGSTTATSSGSDSSSECSIEPANPNSTASVRNLLCYLYEIYGEYTLSGQQTCHWTESELDHINRITGQYPAIIGGDILYDDAVPDALNYWNNGGLSMIRYHMGRPTEADSYESSKCEPNTSQCNAAMLEDTLTPGTAQHQGLLQKFDFAAGKLAQLQDAGVVVIWAPFHESQPNGWFWWSMGTGDQLVRLWRLMFDNFQARGLNNLIWLMPFSGSPDASYYPGADYVDLAGPDTYATGQPFAGMYSTTRSIVGDTIPIPLHETGTIPNPDAMFDGNAAPWLLFNAWCFPQLSDNSEAAILQTYNHERTINRDDLPAF